MDNRTKFKETLDDILSKKEIKIFKEWLLTLEANDDNIEDVFQSLCDYVSNNSCSSNDVILFDYLIAFIEYLINHSKDISQYIQSVLDLLLSHILAFDNINSELKTYSILYHNIMCLCEEAKDFSNNEQLFKHLIDFVLENLTNNYRRIGIECLNELFNKHIFLVQKKAYTKKIWTKVLPIFDSDFKTDILKCLKELILSSQEAFRFYAIIALNKALDFLTGNDTREVNINALEVIEALTIYCDEEMLSIKKNIVDFLSVLKTNNKDIKIKELCSKLLIHFQEFSKKSQKTIINIDSDNEYHSEEGEKENNVISKNEYYSLKDIDGEIDKNNTIQVDNIYLTLIEQNKDLKADQNENENDEEKSQEGEYHNYSLNSKDQNEDNNDEVNENIPEITKTKGEENDDIKKTQFNKEFTFKRKSDSFTNLDNEKKENTKSNVYTNYSLKNEDNIKSSKIIQENQIGKTKETINISKQQIKQNDFNTKYYQEKCYDSSELPLQVKTINENHKEEKNNANDNQIDINEIIKAIKLLSDRQLFLLNSIESFKTFTNNQLSSLSNSLLTLESNIKQISIEIIEEKQQQQPINNSLNKRQLPITYDEIQSKASSNIQEAFNLLFASQNNTYFLRFIGSLSFNQLKQIPQNIYEKAIIHSLSFKGKGRKESIQTIAKFLKNSIIGIKITFSPEILQQIKSFLNEIAENSFDYDINEEDIIDIELLQSHLSDSYSSLLNSFAQKTNTYYSY